MVDDGRRFFFQPCFSPVWDTAIAAYALQEAAPGHPAVAARAGLACGREIRRKGDWSVKRPHTEPSGWAFEYVNEFYPDIDDTAMVLLALGNIGRRRAGMPEARQLEWTAGHAVARWRMGGFRRG